MVCDGKKNTPIADRYLFDKLPTFDVPTS
eukprot:SAG11_NODE_10355_length_837_cov_1.554201_1_plen_28_part_10